jgi:hypothetical protein
MSRDESASWQVAQHGKHTIETGKVCELVCFLHDEVAALL